MRLLTIMLVIAFSHVAQQKAWSAQIFDLSIPEEPALSMFSFSRPGQSALSSILNTPQQVGVGHSSNWKLILEQENTACVFAEALGVNALRQKDGSIFIGPLMNGFSKIECEPTLVPLS